MCKKVFVDIETLPPSEDERASITPDVLRRIERRYRREDGGARQSAECSDEEFRRLALFGEYGRVLAIGVIVEQDGEEILRGVLGRERETGMFHLDERRTLRGFWKLMRDFDVRRDLIVGFNLMDFDLPFILKRSFINRVDPTIKLNFARYRSAPIFDVMREWEQWDCRKRISLADLARVLKVDVRKTEGMSGGVVYERFRAGRHEEVAEYCLQDVEVTRAVYRCICPTATSQP